MGSGASEPRAARLGRILTGTGLRPLQVRDELERLGRPVAEETVRDWFRGRKVPRAWNAALLARALEQLGHRRAAGEILRSVDGRHLTPSELGTRLQRAWRQVRGTVQSGRERAEEA